MENNYNLAIIRINDDSQFAKKICSILDKGEFKYNYKDSIDEDEFEQIHNALIVFNRGDIVSRIIWCSAQMDIPYTHIKLKKIYETSSDIFISSVQDYLLLNIERDFDSDNYITSEYSPKVFEQFSIFNYDKNVEKKEMNYPSRESESNLSKVAQKNEYCLRQYNIKVPAADERNEYRRDYDRILYSKAFRRMADKTQVFSAIKGDHYRIRMTHTMIVCQIARSISNALKLNVDLTEAIALGHDLGHTPFGHVGERTLNDILVSSFPDVGGFKHNYQGLRVVSKLENQYYDVDGLDLSFQVLDGIFKHTKTKTEVKLEEFLDDEGAIEYINQSIYPVTLEGQVVALADEIAQRSHDIDDAISSNLITLKEFTEYLKLNKFKCLKDEVDELEERLCSKHKIISDINELESAQISSAIIKYFINDVVSFSKGNIEKYINESIDVFFKNPVVNEKIISFSEEGELVCKYLEKIISNNVLNSNEVNAADQKSKTIVESLFWTYYNEPQLLHTGTRMRIYKDFYEVGLTDVINLTTGNPKIVKREFEEIKNEKNGKTKLKHKLLVRNICDFIAGMTDSYAINEYKSICKR